MNTTVADERPRLPRSSCPDGGYGSPPSRGWQQFDDSTTKQNGRGGPGHFGSHCALAAALRRRSGRRIRRILGGCGLRLLFQTIVDLLEDLHQVFVLGVRVLGVIPLELRLELAADPPI